MVKMVNFMLHYFTTTKKIFQIKKALLLKRGKFNLFKVFFNYARGVYGLSLRAAQRQEAPAGHLGLASSSYWLQRLLQGILTVKNLKLIILFFLPTNQQTILLSPLPTKKKKTDTAWRLCCCFTPRTWPGALTPVWQQRTRMGSSGFTTKVTL